MAALKKATIANLILGVVCPNCGETLLFDRPPSPSANVQECDLCGDHGSIYIYLSYDEAKCGACGKRFDARVELESW